MQIRKSATALGAALVMLTFGTTAWAEHDCPTQLQIAQNLRDLATEIRCKGFDSNNAGAWTEEAIWLKRRQPSCADHSTAADALYVVSPPRGNPNKPSKIRGAAEAVEQDEFEEAIRDLQGFRLDLMNNDLNPKTDFMDKNAAEWTYDWIQEAKAAEICLMEIMELIE